MCLFDSSSDDGTCRIWDASDSTLHSRVYMPNPKDVNPGNEMNALSNFICLCTAAGGSFLFVYSHTHVLGFYVILFDIVIFFNLLSIM